MIRGRLAPPSSVVLLDHYQARLEGDAQHRALGQRRPGRLRLRAEVSELRSGLAMLPVIEGLRARWPEATLEFTSGCPGLDALIAMHAPRSAAPPAGPELALWLGEPSGAREEEIVVQPKFSGAESAKEAWVRGALAAGLQPSAPSTRLSVSPAAARQAARDYDRGGPLVLVLDSPGLVSWPERAELLARLERGIGAATVPVRGEVSDPGTAVALAAAARLAALCVGEPGDAAEIVAAVGAELLVLGTGRSREPAPELASVLVGPGCSCLDLSRCRCLDPARVALEAERLAARSWPRDRLRRWRARWPSV